MFSDLGQSLVFFLGHIEQGINYLVLQIASGWNSGTFFQQYPFNPILLTQVL